MIASFTSMNRLGVDPHYVYPLSFTTYDSNSTTEHVAPTTISVNNVDVTDFTYNNGVVTLKVPTQIPFWIQIDANKYNSFVSEFNYNQLNRMPVNMVKIQENFEISSILTWNHATVKDLDSHMFVLDESGKEIGHVYYRQQTFSDNNTVVSTTKDDTGNGSGETTTIIPIHNKYTYKFFVHQYSQQSTNNTLMISSNAACNVTLNNEQYTMNIPTDIAGIWWHVYDIVNGDLNIINTVSDSK